MQRNIHVNRLLKIIGTIKSNKLCSFHADSYLSSLETKLKEIDDEVTRLFADSDLKKGVSKLNRSSASYTEFHKMISELLERIKIIGLETKKFIENIEPTASYSRDDRNPLKLIRQVADDLISISKFQPALRKIDNQELVFLCKTLGGLHVGVNQSVLQLNDSLVLTWIDQCIELGTPRYPVKSVGKTAKHFMPWKKKPLATFNCDKIVNFLKQDIPYYFSLDVAGVEEGLTIGIRKHATHIEIYDPNFGHFFFRTELQAGSWLSALFRHYQEQGLQTEHVTLFRYAGDDQHLAVKSCSYPSLHMLNTATVNVEAIMRHENAEEVENKLLAAIQKLAHFMSKEHLDNLIVFLMKRIQAQPYPWDIENIFGLSVYEKLNDTDKIQDTIRYLRKIKLVRYAAAEPRIEEKRIRGALARTITDGGDYLFGRRQGSAFQGLSPEVKVKTRHSIQILPEISSHDNERNALFDFFKMLEYFREGLSFLQADLNKREFSDTFLEDVEKEQRANYLLAMIKDKIRSLNALRSQVFAGACLETVQQPLRNLFDEYDQLVDCFKNKTSLGVFANLLEAVLSKNIKRKYTTQEMAYLSASYATASERRRPLFYDAVNPATPRKLDPVDYESDASSDEEAAKIPKNVSKEVVYREPEEEIEFIDNMVSLIESESYWKNKVSILNKKNAPDGIIEMRQQIAALRRRDTSTNKYDHAHEVAKIIKQVSTERLQHQQHFLCFFYSTRAFETKRFYELGKQIELVFGFGKQKDKFIESEDAVNMLDDFDKHLGIGAHDVEMTSIA